MSEPAGIALPQIGLRGEILLSDVAERQQESARIGGTVR